MNRKSLDFFLYSLNIFKMHSINYPSSPKIYLCKEIFWFMSTSYYIHIYIMYIILYIYFIDYTKSFDCVNHKKNVENS